MKSHFKLIWIWDPIYIYILQYIYTFTYTNMHTYILMHAYIWIYTHIYRFFGISCETEGVPFQANVDLRSCLYIYTSVYIYIYMYIHAYIHTYLHKYVFIGFFGVSCETEEVTFQANVGLRSLLIRALQNLTVNQDANIGYVSCYVCTYMHTICIYILVCTLRIDM
jgi:hypothetical protein